MGGRKPHGTVLVYKGRRYTWSVKGYWRCTAMGDRHNLARLIWEERHGPIPPGHKVIYLDGNRYNLDPKNLACLSHSEVQKLRLQNPKYRVLASATATYGRLVYAIAMKLDPEKARERGRKIWATRHHRYGPSGGNHQGPRERAAT